MPSITPGQLRYATWDEIARLYQPLVDASLDRHNIEDIERWLAEWSDLDAAVQEASVLAMTAAAGARMVFDVDGMNELVTIVEDELEKLGA